MDKDFIAFLFKKIYQSAYSSDIHSDFVDEAFESSFLDLQYHYPNSSRKDLLDLIKFGTGWLNCYLYRLGSIIYSVNPSNILLKEIHWLLKEICSAEIYFSIKIGKGFYVRHGEGIVIGSRCEIGEGFIIHQQCTVGHKIKLGDGPNIGNNVEMGVGSSILGNCVIGNNVIVGAHSLVLTSIPDSAKVVGTPGKLI